MFQTIFNGALHSRGELGRLCRRVRRWILKFADPLVNWDLNGRTLRLPLSHQLPLYRREFPTYSANLERLAAVLHREAGPLRMIDVGANVGDSLALAGIQGQDACLLIEGDPRYFRLLQANTADLSGAVCLNVMLSDRVGAEAAELKTVGGTGQMVASTGPVHTRVLTLDRVLADQPRFRSTQLLKIDVDGYDFRVLRGAIQTVENDHPILFFEQDPALLQTAGEDPDAIWEWLAHSGYVRVFLYDNLGFWLGVFPTADIVTLRQLNAYARQRAGYYFDVVAFAPQHGALLECFELEETSFYSPQPRPGSRPRLH